MTLYPKKQSAIILLLGCIFFVIAGIVLARSQGWIGYLCAGFFGLGIPAAIVRILPGSTYLELTNEGFEFCNMFRKTSLSWEVIDEFFIVTLKQTGVSVHKMVGFNFVDSYDRMRIGRGVSKALSQCEGALPDTYGLKPEELADLLNSKLDEFRQKEIR